MQSIASRLAAVFLCEDGLFANDGGAACTAHL